MRRITISSLALALIVPTVVSAQGGCDTAGLKLPAGFCANVFADSIRQVRSMVVLPNGDVIAAASGGQGGIYVLSDGKSGKAGKVEKVVSGVMSSQLALHDGHLYAEIAPIVARSANAPAPAPTTTAIVRYQLRGSALGKADTIVKDIVNSPGHSTRNFAINNRGELFMNIGSATNACEQVMRKPRTAGHNPCTELDTRAGIWKFDAKKTGQTPSASNHFARGIRNAVGIAIAPDGKLWTTQHGRDDLGGVNGWGTVLGLDSAASVKYNAENPAEELMQVNQNDDFGWPYCYFGTAENKLLLAPEYGGDGKKVEQCAQKKAPVATFPAHWAPNALAFYTGSKFPARYKSGAFIAFHGSWNRAPEPQSGYNVVFQPLDKNGKASGKWEEFAGNFAPNVGSGRATAATGSHRPTGLAVAADGSLLVADDTGGRIYRITFTGGK